MPLVEGRLDLSYTSAMAKVANILFLVLVLPFCLAAQPAPASVADQAVALGASLEAWTRQHRLDDWRLSLESNRTAEVGSWAVTLSFLVGPSVTKDQVDQAELQFYPWFRKTAPGLVPEASFLREETWFGVLTEPDIPVPYGPPPKEDRRFELFSGASVEWFPHPDGKTLRAVRVTWTWPADLTGPLEAAEAQARAKARDSVPVAWTQKPFVPSTAGSEAWAQRALGGTQLASHLEKAYLATVEVSGDRQVLPKYSLELGRWGPNDRWSGGPDPWYPDRARQSLGLSVDMDAPGGSVPWEKWAPVRSLWGNNDMEVTYLLKVVFDTSRVGNLDDWRRAAQEDLSTTNAGGRRGWTWTPSQTPPAKETVELSYTAYDPTVLAELTEFYQRHQR